MSRTCELTGKKSMVGNNVSHSLNRTKRRFDANLIKKRFYIPEEDRWITLKISTSALKTINKIRTIDQRLITVVGCGGDRDTKKRPLIGNLVSELSSYVIFTSDNPRSENPIEILDQILLGVSPNNSKKTDVIVKREKAIEGAYKYSREGDIVLIAGKGHEDYQIIGNNKFEFSESEILTSDILPVSVAARKSEKDISDTDLLEELV